MNQSLNPSPNSVIIDDQQGQKGTETVPDGISKSIELFNKEGSINPVELTDGILKRAMDRMRQRVHIQPDLSQSTNKSGILSGYEPGKYTYLLQKGEYDFDEDPTVPRQGWLVPGYNFMGPGNLMGGVPTNLTDQAARIHDYDYTKAKSNKDIAIMDQQFLDNVNMGYSLTPLSKPLIERLATTVIAAKLAIEKATGINFYGKT